jgi:restriction system protein
MNDDDAAPAVPTFDALMIPALKALEVMGGSASNQELLDKVIELEEYSEEIQNFLHKDNRQTKLNYNLAWAKTYLKKVGAMDNSQRGVWTITSNGEDVVSDDIPDIVKKVRREDAEKQKAKKAESVEEIGDDSADNWKDALLNVLINIEPDAFERLCQRVLREYGFTKVKVTGKVGDGGIDGVGVLRIKLLSFHVAFQCKRYKGSVPAPQIRDFRGSMSAKSDKGLFITTGTFTKDAQDEAVREAAVAIDLIDGDELCELLKELGLGTHTEMVEKVTIDPEWFSEI